MNDRVKKWVDKTIESKPKFDLVEFKKPWAPPDDWSFEKLLSEMPPIIMLLWIKSTMKPPMNFVSIAQVKKAEENHPEWLHWLMKGN